MGRAVKRVSLTTWTFLGLVAGILIGILAPGFATKLGPIATVFLRLIRTIITPLIFGTLVAGIAGSGDLKRMGRIALKAIIYFEVVTTIALFLGLGVVTWCGPATESRWLGQLQPPQRRCKPQ